MNIHSLLSDKVSQALIFAGAPVDCAAQVRQSVNAKFGDYQVNGVMLAAKKMGISSRQLAEKVLPLLSFGEIVSRVEISGPGFINIFLNNVWLASQIDRVLYTPKLGVKSVKPQTIVVDYSAPNIAKEMHVGHLRSTIIGDAVARTLEFLGHNVIRANHVGDWGTQFGMLIVYLEKIQSEHSRDIDVSDLENFYRQAKKHYDKDSNFAARSRACVVKLQSGDPYYKNMWRKLVNISMAKNQLLYNRLNVTLTTDDVMGESSYNGMLPGIVADLKTKGLAVESEGATVVFLEEYQNKNGELMGVVIQKKDGGYLYTTTDLACIKYRYEVLGANRILYYIDSRQHQYLAQVWSIVRKAGYVPEAVSLEHHLFGMILGKDGKPFKTRSGNAVKLSNLLDEAIERATQLIAGKNPHMSEREIANVAHIIGIGAVKYTDLAKNRTTNYIFDWENMLVFEGNTALYIQYAYTRIMSVFKRGRVNKTTLTFPLIICEEHEIALAKCLLQFEEALTIVAREGIPHIICNYLYNLATMFSSFYEHCPILNTNSNAIRQSRLKLALLTAKTLKTGLYTLGIETVERM
ncbi:arginine--tRNA ligase [Candidatus Gillettellia adelgis]